MENYTPEESINNDFLSQSYSQGVERITGTNNFNLNFEIPKEILEVREKTWNYLFDKYSDEPFSDIQVNIITCEPEEEVSEEEQSCGQRIRMHKPASLIQYWINTGNPPYKEFLNDNEDIGSSLSEKESTSSKQSSFSSNKNKKQECRNDSSFSSVDTAAYILSNANITKKTDTMAIIEGAKCDDIKSPKNIKDARTISNNKTEYSRIDQYDCSDDNINTNVSNTEVDSIKYVLKMHTHPSAAISTNTLQSNISQNNIDISKSSPKQLNVRNIHDIASIFQQFDKTLQRLSGNDKEDILDQNKVNSNISDVKQVSPNTIMMKMNQNISDVKRVPSSTIVTKMNEKLNNTNMISQRKKLYTGRDSPIDLILINSHNINRLSETNRSLHPALDTDCIIARKTSLSCKNKNKRLSLGKKCLDFKRSRKKRKRLKFIKNRDRESNKNSTSSYQYLSSFHNNSDMREDIPLYRRITMQENNDTNSSVKDGIYKQDLASLNLNPVVLLERITSSFKRHKPNFVKNNHNMQENSVHNEHFVKTSKELCSCSETEDLQSRISNTSTILICKCQKDALLEDVSSDSSLTLRLSIDSNNPSVVNVGKEVDKLSNSKDIVMIQTKEPRVLIERLPLNKNIDTTITSQVLNKNDDIQQKKVLNKSKIYLCGMNEKDSMNFKEIPPLRINKNCMDTMVKSQILNKNDAIQQKEISKESESHFCNSYKTNKKDNIKLREIKIVLERLPINIYSKRSVSKRSIADVNICSDKKNISQNTSLYNNKIESSIKTKSLTNKKVKILSRAKYKTDNNSLRLHIESKKNDKLNDTSDIVSEHKNKVSDKIEISTNYKCSILCLTSSDEDDFIKLLQEPNRKRLKKSSWSIDNKTLNEANTVNNKNLNTVIFSSKKIAPRKIDNGIVKSLNEENKKIPSVININNRHLDTVIKRNERDRKNDTSIVQTKTAYTDSLHSEESNSHITSRKTLTISSIQRRSQHSNHINKEKLFKGFVRNRCIINSSNSSNSSIEEHNIANQSHDMLLRSSEKIQISKQLAIEEFNNISLGSNNRTKKNNESFSFINDKQDTSIKKQTFVDTFRKNNLNNLSENKQIFDKSKNSVAMQQSSSGIKPTITKLLRFQTKSYYDSDSSISS